MHIGNAIGISSHRALPATRMLESAAQVAARKNGAALWYVPDDYLKLGPELNPNPSFSGATGMGVYPNWWGITGVSGNAATLLSETYAGSQVVRLRSITVGYEGIQVLTPSQKKAGVPYRVGCWVRIPTGVTPNNLSFYPAVSPTVQSIATATMLSAQPKDAWVWYETIYIASAAWSQVSFIIPGGVIGNGFDIAGITVREVLSCSVFQDSAGTTPAFLGSPVGLVLDQSYSDVDRYGANLIPQSASGAATGNPGTLPTAWQGGVSVNGISRQVVSVGADYVDLRLTGTATSTWADYVGAIGGVVSVSPGETYKVDMPETSVVAGAMPSGGSITYGVATQLNGTFVATQTGRSQYVTIPAGVNQLRLFNTIANYSNGAVVDVTLRVYSGVSCRRVYGNHATQSVAASRPTLTRTPRKLGPNLIPNPTFDTSTGWTLGAGWSVASGVVTHASASGATAIWYPNALVDGRYYVASCTSNNPTGLNAVFGNNYVSVAWAGTLGTAVGACAAGVGIGFQLGGDISLDNASVREVLDWGYVLKFDGTDDFLDVPCLIVSPNANTAVASFMAQNIVSSPRVLSFRSTSATNPVSLQLDSDTVNWRGAWRDDAGTAVLQKGSVSTPFVKKVVSLVGESVTKRGYEEGCISIFGSASLGAASVSKGCIGAGNSGAASPSNFIQGEISGVYVAPSVIPDVDRVSVERFLAWQYGANYWPDSETLILDFENGLYSIWDGIA